MNINREQFLRGIAAIQSYRRLVSITASAFKQAGCDAPEDLGGGALGEELTRQLEERCNDTERNEGGTDIEYMLYDAGGPIREADGREFMVSTPELLWAWWETTARGPFSPPPEGT